MVDKGILSPHGIRALSKFHAAHPYILASTGSEYRVDYEPAESQSGTFGGNPIGAGLSGFRPIF